MLNTISRGLESMPGIDPQAVAESEESIQVTLASAGFKLVERAQIEALLKEQALSLSGITAADSVKIGKLASADALLFGKVLLNTQGKKSVVDWDGKTAERDYFQYKLTLRLVSTETGQSVVSQQNTVFEYVSDPKFMGPTDLATHRGRVLDSMGKELKKALAAK